MPSQYHLVFKGSPFIPCFDKPTIVNKATDLVHKGFFPSGAISMATLILMPEHLNSLASENSSALSTYQVGAPELYELDLGYQYPLQTIIASGVCGLFPEAEREKIFKTLVASTRDADSIRAQAQILIDLRATINLLNLDPSSSLLFEFLKKYPLSDSDYFSYGMEIAAVVFYNLAPDVAHQIGDYSWLIKPYDPTIT